MFAENRADRSSLVAVALLYDRQPQQLERRGRSAREKRREDDHSINIRWETVAAAAAAASDATR